MKISVRNMKFKIVVGWKNCARSAGIIIQLGEEKPLEKTNFNNFSSKFRKDFYHFISLKSYQYQKGGGPREHF